jgi:hypothetical protein
LSLFGVYLRICVFFTGLILLLHYCDVVHGIEFIPSIRFHDHYGCHYFEIYQPLPCTFFAPHPKTTEMSLWYKLNKADDIKVFGHGIVQFQGLRNGSGGSFEKMCLPGDAVSKTFIDYSSLPNLSDL